MQWHNLMRLMSNFDVALCQLEEELSGVVEVLGMVSNKGAIMASTYNMLREDKGISFGKFFFINVVSQCIHLWWLKSLCHLSVPQIWSCIMRPWKSFTISLSTIHLKRLQVDEAHNDNIILCLLYLTYCLFPIPILCKVLVQKKLYVLRSVLK